MPTTTESPAVRRVALIGLLAGLAVASSVDAQKPAGDANPRADSVVTVVPGKQYGAGGLHRFFFGRHYRPLWTTPLTVPVLDLGQYAGGLKLVERGGGEQTKSLLFRNSDGAEYVFRSVDKDVAGALPSVLRGTIANDIAQDQISSAHPAGPLVVAPLLDALGVPHPDPVLVVMPDDPALGEHRKEFAGMLGFIEGRPEEGPDGAPGFEGFTDVIGSKELLERLEKDPAERVNARGFLAARLLDLLIGDWDRHKDQWRWGQTDELGAWQPIPRDRDQAFSKFDGVLLSIARNTSTPQLVTFGRDYPGVFGLTWNGRELDRRLLVPLERPTWDSVVAATQAQLTDPVIDDATSRLPPEYREQSGPELARALKERRDDLDKIAADFYRLLASEVDVHATDSADLVEVDRLDGGKVEVRVSSLKDDGKGTGPIAFRRRFERKDTDEIRVYLHGGDDRIVVGGETGGSIRTRVVGGGGNDHFVDSSSGRTIFHDSRGDNQFEPGNASVDERPDRTPPPADPEAPPPRDWGSRTVPLPWLSIAPDAGLVIGAGIARYNYGFRRFPYASRYAIRAAYATGGRHYAVDLTGEARRVSSDTRLRFHARASGIDVLRFYGFGNETVADDPQSDFFRVRQHLVLLEPSIALVPARRLTLDVGPVLKYADTDLDDNSFIATTRPYGAGSFGQVGARAEVRWDGRDQPVAPRRGAMVSIGGAVYPEIWDVATTFGELHGEASTYLSPRIPLRPTLALRAGGKWVSGTFPFHEAAYIGGSTTVRGFSEHRFGGDKAAYGNAELRLFLTRTTIVLPGDFGIFGLTDVGRVFLDGESSDNWHTGVGGGIWFAFVSSANTLTLAIARSDERTGFYLRGGFLF